MLELAELILRTLYEESGGRIEHPVDPLGTLATRYPAIAMRDVASELTVLTAEGLLVVRPQTGAALTTDGLRRLGEMLETSGGLIPNLGRLSKPPAAAVDDDELGIDQIMALVGGHAATHARPLERRIPPMPTPATGSDLPRPGSDRPFRDPASLAPGISAAGFALDEVTRLADADSDPPVARPGTWEEERTETDKGLARLLPRSNIVAAAEIIASRKELENLTQTISKATQLPVDVWTEGLEIARQMQGLLTRLTAVLEAEAKKHER